MSLLFQRSRVVVAALLAIVALAFLPALPAHAAGPGSATITLTRGGEPAPYRSVMVDGPEGQLFGSSDASGMVAFGDLALGAYSGNVWGGFEDQPASFSFVLTETQFAYVGEVEIHPWPTGTGSIAGVVTDAATGAPLEGVTIGLNQILVPIGRSFPTQYTPVDGTYAYGSLPAGTYSLFAYLPGYFTLLGQTIELSEGQNAEVAIGLVAQDAAITGRVVDVSGNGVEGVTVSAQSGINAGAATTGGDGSYTITGLGAGTWSLGLGGSGWPWDLTSVSVDLGSGETLTAPDLVAVPRTTGSIGGLVAGDDQAPEAAGLSGICVEVVDADGDPIGAAVTTTADGFFFFDSIDPGDYSVRFEDCDETRTPHYSTTYLGGSATISGATILTLEAQADLWTDYTFLARQTFDPEPEQAATPASKKALTKATKNLIDAPAVARRGDGVSVMIGTQFAGTWVSVWVYSSPLQLGGWHQVAADGTIQVEIPTSAPLGAHELSVQASDDSVIGWTKVLIKKH